MEFCDSEKMNSIPGLRTWVSVYICSPEQYKHPVTFHKHPHQRPAKEDNDNASKEKQAPFNFVGQEKERVGFVRTNDAENPSNEQNLREGGRER